MTHSDIKCTDIDTDNLYIWPGLVIRPLPLVKGRVGTCFCPYSCACYSIFRVKTLPWYRKNCGLCYGTIPFHLFQVWNENRWQGWRIGACYWSEPRTREGLCVHGGAAIDGWSWNWRRYLHCNSLLSAFTWHRGTSLTQMTNSRLEDTPYLLTVQGPDSSRESAYHCLRGI